LLKIPEFAEERFSQAQKWEKHAAGLVSDRDMLLWEGTGALTDNRLDAAISKVGALIPDDRDRLKAILMALMSDIREHLSETCTEVVDRLSADERDSVWQQLSTDAKLLILARCKAIKSSKTPLSGT